MPWRDPDTVRSASDKCAVSPLRDGVDVASSAYSGCADDRTTRLLTLLHSYQTLHGRGDASLKSCVWNVTKARRDRSYVGTSSAEYSVECVREELRPWALLEQEVGAEGEVGEGGGSSPESGGNLAEQLRRIAECGGSGRDAYRW